MRRTASAPVARVDLTFPWYIGAALALAVLGGFVLALLLPLAVVFGWEWGIRWRALVQVHGHLQVGGWVGLFITGMAFRLVPRFAGRPLRFPGLTLPTLILLITGLLGRMIAQPWLDLNGMPLLLAVAAQAELAGTILFAISVVATLAPVLRTLPPAPLLLAGAAGFVVQAALGALWLLDLEPELPVLPADRNGALLALQFYGFQLPFVLGVSLRALPTFFARPAPAPRWAWVIALALAAGTALYTFAPLAETGATGIRLGAAGALLIAAAMLGVTYLTGVWRPAERLRPSARHIALLLRTAYAWLALAVLALLWVSLHSLADGRPAPAHEQDAIRHILALGVFTTMIVGMAQLVLPWLAMRRQRQEAAQRETRILWALLTGATLLRVAGALQGGGVGATRSWLMAAGGVLGITAVAYFASTVLRAARPQPQPEITVHEVTRP